MQENLKIRLIVFSTAVLLATLSCSFIVDVSGSSLVNVNSPPGSAQTPTFNITLSSYELSVYSGTTQTVTVQLHSIAHYNGTIDLAVNSPSSLLACLAASSLIVTNNQSTNTTMAITVPPNELAGKYTVTVTGRDNGLSQSANITLQVIRPDFTLSTSPGSVEIASYGSPVVYQVHVTSLNRFNGTVRLSAQSEGALAFIFSPSEVTLHAGETKNVALTVSAHGVWQRSVAIYVKGIDASGISHSTAFNVEVLKPDFEIGASPKEVSVVLGNYATFTIQLRPIDKFNGSISLSSSRPSGWKATVFSPPQVSILNNQPEKVTVTVRVPANAAAGKYEISITGSSNMTSHTIPIYVQVLEP